MRMLRRVKCVGCVYYESGACCESPQPLRKNPTDWCGRGYPRVDLDPEQAGIYAGLLMTMELHVLAILEDPTCVTSRLPLLEAWATQANKTLHGEEFREASTTPAIQRRDEQATPPVLSPKFVAVLFLPDDTTANVPVNCADELLAGGLEFAFRLSSHTAYDSVVFPFQFMKNSGEYPEFSSSDGGWSGKLLYEWDNRPLDEHDQVDDLDVSTSACGEYKLCYYRVTLTREPRGSDDLPGDNTGTERIPTPTTPGE